MNSLKTSFFILSIAACAVASTATAHAANNTTPPRPPATVETLNLPPEIERGVVRLRVLIDQAGRPQKITVLAPCNPVIESRLVPAVAKWQFTPATKNGQPVVADVILPLNLVQLSAPVPARL